MYFYKKNKGMHYKHDGLGHDRFFIYTQISKMCTNAAKSILCQIDGIKIVKKQKLF